MGVLADFVGKLAVLVGVLAVLVGLFGVFCIGMVYLLAPTGALVVMVCHCISSNPLFEILNIYASIN